MRKFLGNVIIFVYSIIAIILTVLLLSYNSYNCSFIGGYTVYPVNGDLQDFCSSGDLLLIKYIHASEIEVGDKIFLYNNLSSSDYEIVLKEVTNLTKNGSRTIFTVDEDLQYDSIYLIGRTTDVTVIPKLGTVLAILESRWGYLFFVVVVTLLLLLQEIFELFLEIRYGDESQESA